MSAAALQYGIWCVVTFFAVCWCVKGSLPTYCQIVVLREKGEKSRQVDAEGVRRTPGESWQHESDREGSFLPSQLIWKRTQQHSNLNFCSGQVFEVSSPQTDLAIALKTHFGYDIGCNTNAFDRGREGRGAVPAQDRYSRCKHSTSCLTFSA